jgi:cell division protein YceG involved in septum cleavage
MYNKAKATQKDGETPSTMINTTALSPAHMAIVKAFIEFNEGSPLFTLKQLWAANQALRNRKYAPYFIAKNLACKSKTFGVYDLSKLKVSAQLAKAEAKAAEQAEPVTLPEGETTAPAKTKRKSNAKKEASPKRESRKKPAQPAETKELAPAATDEPATIEA